MLWRLTRGGEPHLLAVAVDPDVLRLTRMAKAMRREVHELHPGARQAAGDARGATRVLVAGEDAREGGLAVLRGAGREGELARVAERVERVHVLGRG